MDKVKHLLNTKNIEIKCKTDSYLSYTTEIRVKRDCRNTLKKYMDIAVDKYMSYFKENIVLLEGKDLLNYIKDQNKRDGFGYVDFNFWLVENTYKNITKTKGADMRWLFRTIGVILNIEELTNSTIWNNDDFKEKKDV